jgi:hypothetical protein
MEWDVLWEGGLYWHSNGVLLDKFYLVFIVITYGCNVFINVSFTIRWDCFVSHQNYLTFIIPFIPQNFYVCDKAKIVSCREYSNIVDYFFLLVWQDCVGWYLCLKLLTVTYHMLWPLPSPSTSKPQTQKMFYFSYLLIT